MKRKARYARIESTKAELRALVKRLAKRNLELQRELYPWRELKEAILRAVREERSR